MASNFFSSTIAHVGAAAAQAATQTEIRVGGRTVQIQRRLAEGGFGVVELVTDIYTKQELVLKRCNIDRPESFDIANTEIKMLQKFKGPYVVSLLDSCIHQKTKTSREACLLMEYCTGDHLLNRLLQRNGSYLPQDAIFRMFGQLCLGVKEMHLSRPVIVHRDLKLENILFGPDGKVRMCDFGSCVESPIYIRNVDERQAADEHIQKETTQMYRAPEMVDLYMRPTLTEKTDIWALGCMLFAMCFLIHPFMDGSSLGILNAKIHFPPDSPFSEDLHALILRILDIDPECRPTIVELIDLVTALAHGKPLPPQVLSAEAEQCRAARIASTQLRESKANSKLKAKQATKPAPKVPVTLSSNSVAARRLATMRGQPLPDEPVHRETTAYAGNGNGNTRAQDSFAQQNHSPVDDDGETFDPFGNDNAAPAPAAAAVGSFAAFESSPARASFTTFPAAAAATDFDEDDSFDPFGTSSSAAPSAAFAHSGKDDGFTATHASHAKAAATTKSDGFDSFVASSDAWDSTPAFPTHTTAATGGFDAFDTSAAYVSTNDGFSPVATATTATPHAGGFSVKFDSFDDDASGFDSFAPTPGAPANAQDDVFSPSGGPRAVPHASGGAFNAFEDTGDGDTAHQPPLSTTSASADCFFEVSDVITPTAATAGSDGFFATDDDFAAQAPTPMAPKSAASLLFDSYTEEEEPTSPVFSAPPAPTRPAPAPKPLHKPTPAAATATAAVQQDVWASSAPLMPLAPAPAAPAAPLAPAPASALIDLFGDDLLVPASASGSPRSSGPPTASGNNKPRNPLDLMSLYDQPLTPAPQNTMMGSSPGMNNMGRGGPNMGMSPMAGTMGMGFNNPSPGYRPPQQPMGGMNPNQNMNMNMNLNTFMGTPPAGRGPTMMSPTGNNNNNNSGAMYGSGGPGPAGGNMSMGMGYNQTHGRPMPPPKPSHLTYGGQPRPAQSQDPFDSINALKR